MLGIVALFLSLILVSCSDDDEDVYKRQRQWLGSSLLLCLWERHLDGVRNHDGGGNHKENQQQEYDVRHGSHAEAFVYFCSSF